MNKFPSQKHTTFSWPLYQLGFKFVNITFPHVLHLVYLSLLFAIQLRRVTLSDSFVWHHKQVAQLSHPKHIHIYAIIFVYASFMLYGIPNVDTCTLIDHTPTYVHML